MDDTERRETPAAPMAQPVGATSAPKQDDVAQAASGLAETVRESTSETVGSAVREAHAHADSAKKGVANEMSDVASALRVAAGELRDGSAQERIFAQVADSLADASEAIEGKELSELAESASAFARRNPLVFLGGAALLGFAASRFAKASGGPGLARRDDPPVPRPVGSAPSSAGFDATPPGALGRQVYRGTEV